ncbi:hypothetical protein EG328_000329 [Venturia inaequalis]|uniref:Uncharacterized protein n=1 Tax=Venturia inaequalis TaxID=5025 RepID=A0A8H3Z8S8_VENIN|nr:hypothetical protein EG328_000329 [Venturia inaequalis]KAE9990355.1 hypothetical protein EG327_001537 [Venturia inaequalis]RDI78418.1 hypothetical protein Vi05172_g11578 [Venturia inaequalis]
MSASPTSPPPPPPPSPATPQGDLARFYPLSALAETTDALVLLLQQNGFYYEDTAVTVLGGRPSNDPTEAQHRVFLGAHIGPVERLPWRDIFEEMEPYVVDVGGEDAGGEDEAAEDVGGGDVDGGDVGEEDVVRGGRIRRGLRRARGWFRGLFRREE